MNKLLAGASAVVTGAGGGIGRGHALLLAEYGARVVVNDINAEAAKTTVGEIVQAGGKAIVSTHNIATRAGADGLIGQCREAFGEINILVNNAGNLRDRTLLKMTDDDFDAVWLVHVKGTFWCAQAGARAMKEQGKGGSIINTTSASHFGNFGQTNYAGAKGAISSMTYTWAIELAALGIRVNAICPIASTQMTRHLMGQAGNNEDDPYNPERCAPLVVYLASQDSDNVTGQIFGVGGERLSYVIRPHFGKTLNHPGGWTVEAVQECFQREFLPEFGPFGIGGEKYPYANGVGKSKR